MITLIDYKAGNLRSVQLALEAIGEKTRITADPDDVRNAERILFPGVGAARAAMGHLRSLGLLESIREAVRRGTPFLGICLGMQILLDFSEEDGGTETLGLVPGKVVRFQPTDPREKVPQIGWNQLRIERPHPLLGDIADESDFYFVHTYYPVPTNAEDRLGSTEYGGVRFASMIGRDNLVATQFHPEKSGPVGLQLLRNFVLWNP